MDTSKEKIKFIKNEIFASSIAGAFRQGKGYPIYHNGEEITDKQRSNLYNFIRNILDKYEADYKNKVTEGKHIKNIENIQKKINDNFKNILYLRFGRTQKLLNLYLKYLWVLDLITEPPHCPFDAIIITKLKSRLVWTKLDRVEDYENLVKLAKNISSENNSTIAEWELTFWNNDKTLAYNRR